MELAAHFFIDTAAGGIGLTPDGRAAIAECAQWLAGEPGGAGALLKRSPSDLEEELLRIAGSALGRNLEQLAAELEGIAEKRGGVPAR